MPAVKKVLVLGTGLCSIVRIMHAKGFDPDFTLVEYDEQILQLAVKYLSMDFPAKINPVCADAMIFMEKNTARYDLVFIDIFIGRIVPDFVTTSAFLERCRESLAPNGRLAFNYIINDTQKWEQARLNFSEIFPGHKIIDHDINRIFITG